MAGQGTISLDLMQQLPRSSVDMVFIPVGGGGLISGMEPLKYTSIINARIYLASRLAALLLPSYDTPPCYFIYPPLPNASVPRRHGRNAEGR